MTTEPDSANSVAERPVGVHVLSEFIYCQRAGLHKYEQDEEDHGRETPILRLDYQPCYELREIEQRLVSHLSAMWQLIFLMGAFALAGILLGFFAHGAFFWAGLGAVAVLGFPLVRQFIKVMQLDRQRRQALSARGAEPDPDSPDDEPVNWWSLKAAGLEAMLCQDLLVDPEVNLRGRPWRILRRGDVSIPVFVRKSPGRIRRQQRARIAAYCQLIRVCEGAQSPYGVILDPGTYRGVAVKPTHSDLRFVRTRLEKLRHVIEQAERFDLRPPPPKDNGPCRRCPLGRPRKYRPGVTETRRHTELLSVNGRRTGPRKVLYHSPCGDRYDSWPPHEYAQKLDASD